MIDVLGVENSYLLAFILASAGGVSSFTAAPFYTTILTMAAGGADIILLGLIAGSGLAISDTLFYYLGKKGKAALNSAIIKKAEQLSAWIAKKPAWLIPLFAFAYLSLAPFPNDILIITLALIDYPFKRLLPLIVAGDITAVILVSIIGKMGIRLFM